MLGHQVMCESCAPEGVCSTTPIPSRNSIPTMYPPLLRRPRTSWASSRLEKTDTPLARHSLAPGNWAGLGSRCYLDWKSRGVPGNLEVKR